jgi:hypothetical protein
VYYSPPLSFANSGGDLQLVNNPANTDTSFLGYDIYYKVYPADSPSADTDYSLIGTVNDTVNYTPDSALKKLTDQGFIKMGALDSADILGNTLLSEPLIKATIGVQSTFYFSLDNSVGAKYWKFYDTSTPLATTNLVRGISRSPLATFNSAYNVNDGDDPSITTGAGASASIDFVFFAVAYGIDLSSASPSTPIYSFPTGAQRKGYTLPNPLPSYP